MAYITAKEVKVIRENIKKAFPAKQGWKFSVINRDHSEVDVSIMSAPKEYGFEGNESVNHYWIAENYKDNLLQRNSLQKIYNIIRAEHWDESDSMTDYFHCAFYISLNIGKFDKSCVSI